MPRPAHLSHHLRAFPVQMWMMMLNIFAIHHHTHGHTVCNLLLIRLKCNDFACHFPGRLSLLPVSLNDSQKVGSFDRLWGEAVTFNLKITCGGNNVNIRSVMIFLNLKLCLK